MTNQNRPTGIQLVPEAPWGTHFCLFYRTKEDLLDLLVPYFKAGLENNEFCMWVTSKPLHATQARQALRKVVKDFKAHEARGQIEILDYSRWYTLGGHFDADRVLDGWVAKEQQARELGFDGLRLTGNTFWLEEADWRAFTDYEAAVDRVISQYRMIALCTYSLEKCGASEVIDVTNNHQFALVKRSGRWQMIESADRRRAEQARQYAAELEQRVKERTLELQALNADLEKENAERKRKEKELDRLNRTLKAHIDSDQAQIHADNESEYLKEICRIVVEDCGHAMVWIGYAEDDAAKTVRPVAFAGFEAGYIETLRITWADTERGRGPTGTAIRTGKPSLCRNMLINPQFEPWRAEALRRGYASSIGLPLMDGGKAFGALTIYSREPDPFSDDEVKLLSELSEDLSFGIAAIRLRRAHDRAEAALRQSEERYRALFNGMTEGFAVHEIICDTQGQPVDYCFLDINPAFERLTGFRREEVVGRTVSAVLPGIEPYWVQTYGQVALTGQPIHFENYSSALQRHYEVFAYSPAPRQFAALFVDVTERKLAEERIRKLNHELEVQAEELQVANVSLEEQAEELRVANANMEEALANEHEARAQAEASQRILEQVQQEIQTLNRDLEHRNTELAIANQELEAFSYSVSHDLRTPLASIDGFSRLVLNDYGPQLPEQTRRYLHLIHENALAMSRLIEDLLVFSRSSRQPLHKHRVLMAELAREVVAKLVETQGERQVEIVIGNLPACQGDPHLLRQVLINLLSNALKFTRRREVARIEIGYDSRDDECAYFVKDNGVGFDVEQADKLFGVFQRFHSAEEYEGNGVGLAIVERIIRRHGGRVWAEAEVNRGAAFYFTLSASDGLSRVQAMV